MLPIQAYELNWIVAFQGSGELRRIMIWFSYLGSEAFWYVLPFTYFVLSRREGTRLFLLFSVSSSLLDTLKVVFHLPRPFWVDSRIKALSRAGNYGMPSGHVLAASVVWPLVAESIGKPWAWFLALSAVLLVSVSRVYLGVHFISDVVGAWITAAGLIWGFNWLERRFSKWLASESLCWQIGITLSATLVLLALGALVRNLNVGVMDPPAWSRFSIGGRDLAGLFLSSGEFFGAACGSAMAGRWARFEVSGAYWRRGVSLTYALAGTFLLRELAKAIPAPTTHYLQLTFEFLRGAISAWWILFLAPWLLMKASVLWGNDLEKPSAAPGNSLRQEPA